VGRYLFTDYDRKTFTISQALFPDTNIPKKLTSVFAPSNTTNSTTLPKLKTSKQLSAPIIAGISVAAVFLLAALIALTAFILHYYSKKRKSDSKNPNNDTGTAEIDSDEKARYEVGGEAVRVEMSANRDLQPELEERVVYEMLGTEVDVQELESKVFERPSSMRSD
jgi:hypothetical protein